MYARNMHTILLLKSKKSSMSRCYPDGRAAASRLHCIVNKGSIPKQGGEMSPRKRMRVQPPFPLFNGAVPYAPQHAPGVGSSVPQPQHSALPGAWMQRGFNVTAPGYSDWRPMAGRDFEHEYWPSSCNQECFLAADPG